MAFELYQPTKAEALTLTVEDYYNKNKEKFANDILIEGILTIGSGNNKFETPAFIIKNGYAVMQDIEMTYELYMSSITPKIYITTGKDNYEYPAFPYKQSNGYVTLALHPDVVYEHEVEKTLSQNKANLNYELFETYNYPDKELLNISVEINNDIQIVESKEKVSEVPDFTEEQMTEALLNKKMIVLEVSSSVGKFTLIDKVTEKLNLQLEEIEVDNSFKGSVEQLSTMLKQDFSQGQIVLLDAMSASKPNLLKFLKAIEDIGVQLVVIDHAKNHHDIKTCINSYDSIEQLIASYDKPLLSKSQSMEKIKEMQNQSTNNQTVNKNTL
jgi:hypothetical protein